MTQLVERIRRPLMAWPGRLETGSTVKRRLLLVAVVMAVAISGAYVVAGLPEPVPWSPTQLRDLSGLPNPPAPFAPTDDGDLRRLSPEEYQQLQEIRRLIERFPVPEEFARVDEPGQGGGGR